MDIWLHIDTYTIDRAHSTNSTEIQLQSIVQMNDIAQFVSVRFHISIESIKFASKICNIVTMDDYYCYHRFLCIFSSTTGKLAFIINLFAFTEMNKIELFFYLHIIEQ